MSRTTHFIAAAGLAALFSIGAASAAVAAPSAGTGVIGWDSYHAVSAGAPSSDGTPRPPTSASSAGTDATCG